MVGCRPKNTIVFNTVADWDGVKSDLAYAGLFRNYEDSSTHLALLPHASFKKTGFLGIDEGTMAASTSSCALMSVSSRALHSAVA